MVMPAARTYSIPATLLFCCLLLIVQDAAGQQLDSLISKVDIGRFVSGIKKKAGRLEERLLQKSMKVLERVQREEERIYRKMLKGEDSALAREKIKEIREKYEVLRQQSKKPAVAVVTNQYIPKLDSLATALKWLDKSGFANITDALAKTKSLQQQFQQAENIRKFIRQRKEELRERLESLGMLKELKKINKNLYYFAAQVKEYKEILKDPKKIEKKVLEHLSKTKWFQEFFRKNSLLASLFRMPGDPNDPSYLASLSGLQTRAQVNAIVQQQIQGGGPNAQQAFQQSIQAAQSQLNQLKTKIINAGGGSSEDIMPDGFKPNGQKTKSFLKRLEYGANLQSQKANGLFPVTSDIGLSLGYKLDDKSILGIGACYKLGWGHGWDHISLTSEGVGLRSYLDWKIKGSFWISGGFEMNYKTAFRDFDVLRDMNAWQKSGLLGVSKTLPVKSKFLKKTMVTVLWDFLSYGQVPKTEPIKFRIGYNFK
jgi:hypothetical protein